MAPSDSSAPDTTSMPGGATPFRACSSSSREIAGPSSTSFSSRRPVERMISFAPATSSTPGSCTRIWSPATP